jgi:CheY-like chemotaxis protein
MPEAKAVSTVLIVEDEILVRMHGAEMLEDAGFVVLEAANADEALEILDGLDLVHLLFSDIDMPGSMDGLELARLVHERWPLIRLLLTSGFHRLDPSKLPAKGQFMRKPWENNALVERVRELIAA